MSTRSDARRGCTPLALLLVAVGAMLASTLASGATTGVDPNRASARVAAPTIVTGIVGSVTDGSTGLAGIDVRIYDPATGVARAKTRTLADGTYAVVVPAGSYKVRFSDAAGNWRLQWFGGASTIAEATAVAVVDGGTTAADATLVATATRLHGQTATATDRIIPLPGIEVRAYDATTRLLVARTTSGGDGTYALADLPPGRYLVRFSDPAGTYGLTWYPATGTIAGAAPVVVTTSSPARADVLLWTTAAVTGTVGGAAGPLAGIDVRLYDANSRALVAKTVTASDGSYAFERLHMGSYGRGDYRVRFSDPTGTYALQWFDGQPTEATAGLVRIDVREGPSSAFVAATMVGTGLLSGQVTMGTAGIAGISVRIYTTTARRVAEVTTGPDGRWSARLAEGAYKVGFGDDSGRYLPVWFSSSSTFAAATPIDLPTAATVDIGAQALEPASPLDLTVDVAADAPDASPGDGVCDDGSGSCPLRAAIDETNASPTPDTITIAPGIDPTLTIAGPAEDANATGDLDSSGALTIHGNGATLDAAGLDRGLQQLGRLQIDDLVVTGGTTAADHLPPRGDDGGGILAFGDVTLTDTTLTGNTAVRTQSGRGGGIAVLGNLTMVRGTVTDNVAENLGGGIWALGATTVITDSSIDGNRTSVLERDAGANGSASAVDIGSNEVHAGTATISGTTISNNVSTLCCGSQSGGGLILFVTTATVRSSTIVGNAADMVPGGFVTIGGGAGVSGLGGDVALIDVTVADNTGYEGIYQLLPMAGVGPFTVRGSIVSGPSPVCNGAWISLGWNVLSDPSCETPYANTTDRVVADPLLGPLARNGGPTATRLPLEGSAALDAVPVGSPVVCDGTIATDQRGVARPQGAACDIGATERSP